MIDEPFIRSIGIVVIAATVFALGARMVSLPSIVAFIAAGLLLGPLTGIIEVSEAIHLIAETGIVLLLFLVGLELSFEKIRGVGFAAIVAGSLQIILTVLGGFGLCLALGFAKMPALIIGIALTFSSTVIVVKLLIDNQDGNKRYGQIAIGILLVQDLFVVILLTLVSGLSGGASLDFAVVVRGLANALGGMALLLAVVLATSKWLLRVPFTWAARSPETLFIWSLCWCFLIVVATHFLHLSPEIGAFIAGISLAQLPYHRDLQRRVQPLMHFFIAVFFVSLGIEMKLDVSLIFWVKAAILALFVVVGKFVIVMFVVARLGYSERTSYFAALLLTQVSEFSFILIALAVEGGFVDATAAALLGLVGLISITVSTVAIVFREPLYETVHRLGLCRMFRAGAEDRPVGGEALEQRCSC
jgi:Kef-type K+ transport system membrane component KefB